MPNLVIWDKIDRAGGSYKLELNTALHDLVFDFALSDLLRMKGRTQEAEVAENRALARIVILNKKVKYERK